MAKTQENPNLAVYNSVRSVPDTAKKAFNNGSFSGTDINPMWRIKTLTETFGAAGIGWYYKVVEHWTETLLNETAVNVRIELYVRDPKTSEWSMPIEGIGGSKSIQQFSRGAKVSDEGYKMALTDAISVACKALGIGADVYWDKDVTKYSAYETAPVAPAATLEGAIEEANAATSYEALSAVWAKYPQFSNEIKFVQAIQNNTNNNGGRTQK